MINQDMIAVRQQNTQAGVRLQLLDNQCGRSATLQNLLSVENSHTSIDITHPIADTGRTILSRLQCMNQGDNDTRARVADGMTESHSTTVDRVSVALSVNEVVAHTHWG